MTPEQADAIDRGEKPPLAGMAATTEERIDAKLDLILDRLRGVSHELAELKAIVTKGLSARIKVKGKVR